VKLPTIPAKGDKNWGFYSEAKRTAASTVVLENFKNMRKMLDQSSSSGADTSESSCDVVYAYKILNCYTG